MQPGYDFMTDIAEFDRRPDQILWRAESPADGDVRSDGDAVVLELPFRAYRLSGALEAVADRPVRRHELRVEALAGGALRLRVAFGPAGGASGAPAASTPMLDPAGVPPTVPLRSERRADGSFVLVSGVGRTAPVLVRLNARRAPNRPWSTLLPAAPDDLRADFFPESGGAGGAAAVALAAWDQFFPGKLESVALGYLEAGGEADAAAPPIPPIRSLFAFAAGPAERFAGTGERFGRGDLAGKTVVLENTDALGVNSRRAYKNAPFWLSSRGYGVFVHDSVRMVLSFADVSSRAVQGVVDAAGLDLFLFPGKPEEVLRRYRRITGFPPELPAWSYGVWLAKMSYYSAAEAEGVVDRCRAAGFPLDVIHLDTGWFETDWVCEWRFSKERFPDPAGFMAGLRRRGVRTSLWQTPNIGAGNRLFEEAVRRRYLPPLAPDRPAPVSDFSGQDPGGQIDFTNPEAVAWYRGLLRGLFDLGAAVIKTDFGEKIRMDADFRNLPAARLRNLYGLLYQAAAFAETAAATGAGIVWARAAWAGCQRYPLHWGGDAEASWDGLAASIRGGLQFGMSGFGYWASDVGGFHGKPEFMNDGPSAELYLRWTQAMVFASHFRYHGTSDREPYAYPEIAAGLRAWLRLRYALIPYIRRAGEACLTTGYPVMRALALMAPDEDEAWTAEHQFFCGDDILAAPVISPDGRAAPYLPSGDWVDFWTGQSYSGRRRLAAASYPLGRIPIFLRAAAQLPYYPEPVACTDEMDFAKTAVLRVDGSFRGAASSPLGALTGLA